MPEYSWEDDDAPFPKGVDVLVGLGKMAGIVYSRSKTANGAYIYGIRWTVQHDAIGRRAPDSVDCYCEAGDMESMLF